MKANNLVYSQISQANAAWCYNLQTNLQSLNSNTTDSLSRILQTVRVTSRRSILGSWAVRRSVKMFKKLKLLGRAGKNKPKPGVGNTNADAVQKLRDTEELFVKKQTFLEEQIAEQLQIIRANNPTNKTIAKRALLKKKRLEKCLDACSAQLVTLEIQRETLENATINTEVFRTMTGAAGALKTAHKTLDVDKVHEIMDEIAEQRDISEEINDAISKPAGFVQVDDDELDRELDELTQLELDRKLLDIGKKPLLDTTGEDTSDEDKAQGPSTSKKLTIEASKAKNSRNKTAAALTKQEQEEEDLKELQKWAIN